jgi:hypothetical protein
MHSSIDTPSFWKQLLRMSSAHTLTLAVGVLVHLIYARLWCFVLVGSFSDASSAADLSKNGAYSHSARFEPVSSLRFVCSDCVQ